MRKKRVIIILLSMVACFFSACAKGNNDEAPILNENGKEEIVLCIPGILFKGLGSIASLAMVLAVNSVNSTCLFLTYQPDVPDELKE